MKHLYTFLLFFLLLQLNVDAQYYVDASTTRCDLPECQEFFNDTSIINDKSRGINQTKTPTAKEEGIKQKVYQIESLNAVIFIPEAFIPLESSFMISGAISHISKVQIYNLENEELIFQTSIPENTWGGKWKEKPQYGFFKYIITIQLPDNQIETIEGVVETKNPI